MYRLTRRTTKNMQKIAFSNSIRIVSDIHLEKPTQLAMYNSIQPTPMKYLALLGDIGDPSRPNYREFLLKQAGAYEQVFLVAGNHEYYGKCYQRVNDLIKSICDQASNIQFLNNSKFKINAATPINIIGGTLWSHIPDSRAAELAKTTVDLKYIYYDYLESQTQNAATYINPQNVSNYIDAPNKSNYINPQFENDIQCGNRRGCRGRIQYGSCGGCKDYYIHRQTRQKTNVALINYRIIQQLHADCVKFIDDNISETDTNIILTHHAPSFDCLKDHNSNFVYKNGNDVKEIFATDLSRYFTKNIKYWCYGHTHIPYHKKINNTTLLSNPLGYRGLNFNIDCAVSLD